VRFAASTSLPVEPAAAWSVLVRWEDQARWLRDADSVRVLTDRREGIGTVVAVKTRVLHVPMFTERLEVVAWEPPRRLVVRHRGFVRGEGTWTLEPEGAGTRFTWVEDLRLPPPILGEAALRAYRPFMLRLMRGGLADLRALVAGGLGSGP
jgi:carbon monoxide dehydrogenase subunit G